MVTDGREQAGERIILDPSVLRDADCKQQRGEHEDTRMDVGTDDLRPGDVNRVEPEQRCSDERDGSSMGAASDEIGHPDGEHSK
jgi:hypothetical protein